MIVGFQVVKQICLVVVIGMLVILTKGCAASESISSLSYGGHEQRAILAGSAGQYSETVDTTHPGSTRQAERDSVRRQMLIVAAVVLVVLFLGLFVAIAKKGA